MNMFEKAKSHFRFYFCVCVIEMALISLYFSVLVNILVAFFFFLQAQVFCVEVFQQGVS